ncbi:hypothetical protein MNEG_6649 [Monoraphidium neglectum]|uniref:Uncharacterized protein n=1 Tax=Monoraphidium neglectum TaxID=145388 RepID=A0A0D2L207_9CHLO|nr:hypothetical protein MNEG_6649 [Monoraphidium neglectum]KIZ01314.1 hypothetical protein MNEG_6649 [Monoraphidium neglectum]|eukprot:XP_013900333.1 hypothetical protein MNEG_6649 [Monoraphidium neglectum]
MKDIAHTAAIMVRQGKTLRGALAAKTRTLNSRLASHKAVVTAEAKAAERASKKAAGEPVSDSEPDSPTLERERQEKERQERERQDRQLQRAERIHGMLRAAARGRGRGRRGRGRGRGGGHGAVYEEDPAARRQRVAAAGPKETDLRTDENAMLSFGQRVRPGQAGGVLGIAATWGGLANGANAEGMPFGWGRPIVGAVPGPASSMPPGSYLESVARFAAGAGARVHALVQQLLGPQLRALEPEAVAQRAAQKAAAAAQQQQQQ